MITVIGRTRGNDAAFKTSESFHDVCDGIGICIGGEGGGKETLVATVMRQHGEEMVALMKSQFHGMIPKHRNQGLLFQLPFACVAPGQDRIVRDVNKAHGASGMVLASGSHCDGKPVCEGQLLLMAGCARLTIVN